MLGSGPGAAGGCGAARVAGTCSWSALAVLEGGSGCAAGWSRRSAAAQLESGAGQAAVAPALWLPAERAEPRQGSGSGWGAETTTAGPGIRPSRSALPQAPACAGRFRPAALAHSDAP